MWGEGKVAWYPISILLRAALNAVLLVNVRMDAGKLLKLLLGTQMNFGKNFCKVSSNVIYLLFVLQCSQE